MESGIHDMNHRNVSLHSPSQFHFGVSRIRRLGLAKRFKHDLFWTPSGPVCNKHYHPFNFLRLRSKGTCVKALVWTSALWSSQLIGKTLMPSPSFERNQWCLAFQCLFLAVSLGGSAVATYNAAWLSSKAWLIVETCSEGIPKHATISKKIVRKGTKALIPDVI